MSAGDTHSPGCVCVLPPSPSQHTHGISKVQQSWKLGPAGALSGFSSRVTVCPQSPPLQWVAFRWKKQPVRRGGSRAECLAVSAKAAGFQTSPNCSPGLLLPPLTLPEAGTLLSRMAVDLRNLGWWLKAQISLMPLCPAAVDRGGGPSKTHTGSKRDPDPETEHFGFLQK